ncbi:MAG: S-layer homology domain-containing protein [Clostridia bacterium]|nr:S-layer homology domain-containing protein [Clostridia bacterium]
MKRLIALIIALAMVAAMSLTAVAADPTTLSELLADNNIPSTKTVDVPVDIKMDVGGTGSFVDGPLTKTGSAKVDYRATLYMKAVRNAYNLYMTGARFLVAGVSDLSEQLENCKISGQFTIKITYPESAKVPEVVLNSGNLYGFNNSASLIFTEASRTVDSVVTGKNELTITLNVAGTAPERPGYVLARDMTANLETYLPDITLTCEDVEYLEKGEFKVVGSITGTTLIHDQAGNLVVTINYNGKQGTEQSGIVGDEISETIRVVSTGGANAGPGTVTPPKKDVTVSIDTNGVEGVEDIVISKNEKNPAINIEELEESIGDKREGFVLEGFYKEPTYATKLEGEVPVKENTTIYARWINVTPPAALNSDDHILYIKGYPDGTVRPEDNISREEIATIFYRLLREDIRAKIETDKHSFDDVEEDRWSVSEIATMAKGGYLKGYTDGSFRPGAYITRAELATIASRFLDSIIKGNRTFGDIDGHWAEENIKSIANNEWIIGYDDGNFRPDDYITRAEAITIINRIIVRYVNEDGLHEDFRKWPDNPEHEWYYYAVIESSNEHDFVRDENGYHEDWHNAEH